MADLAALYVLGVIKNHPFVDGNKRVGTVLLETFLELHEHELTADDDGLLAVIISLGAGKVSDPDFTTWVHEHARRLH